MNSSRSSINDSLKMASTDSLHTKKNKGNTPNPENTPNSGNTSNPRLLREYIDTLKSQLAEEQEQKEALSLERAKLKVCWEMTLEELASTRSELMEKIINLEAELQKQLKRRKFLQKLVYDYERNMDEMKGIMENIIERPKRKL